MRSEIYGRTLGRGAPIGSDSAQRRVQGQLQIVVYGSSQGGRLAVSLPRRHSFTSHPPTTPDSRYIVVRGRLWRCANPRLSEEERAELVAALMTARRAKQVAMRTGDAAAREVARSQVDVAKVALGERGPVWWDDGAPDLNRHLARTTPYAAWFASLPTV